MRPSHIRFSTEKIGEGTDEERAWRNIFWFRVSVSKLIIAWKRRRCRLSTTSLQLIQRFAKIQSRKRRIVEINGLLFLIKMPSGSDDSLPYHPLQRTAASRRPPPGTSACSARNKFAMRNRRRWPSLECSPSDIRIDSRTDSSREYTAGCLFLDFCQLRWIYWLFFQILEFYLQLCREAAPPQRQRSCPLTTKIAKAVSIASSLPLIEVVMSCCQECAFQLNCPGGTDVAYKECCFLGLTACRYWLKLF